MVSTACLRQHTFAPGACSRSKRSLRTACRAKGDKPDKEQLPLDPVELGRRSRQAVDEIWKQVTRLSSPTSSFSLDQDPNLDTSTDNFVTPQAEFTNVLVVGATGKTGRILVRKLLLRGYGVRVMVRSEDASVKDRLPANVEIMQGDVGSLEDCEKAVDGMDKIMYCATSDLDLSAQVTRVDHVGVGFIARAWLDSKYRASQRGTKTPSSHVKEMLADFSNTATQDEWDLMHIGPLEGDQSSSAQFYTGQDFANALLTEDRLRLEFSGSVYSRQGIVDWGGPVSGLQNGEGVVLNCLTDGKPYLAMLVDDEGHAYAARFSTRLGWNSVRLPFNTFSATDSAAPPLDLSKITTFKFRFDKTVLRDMSAVADDIEESRRMRNSFAFELDWLKLQPTQAEPAFVLVSCAGVNRFRQGSDEAALLDRKTSAKRRGEQLLRNSGVAYTIVRPGPLLEEPGGYRAMVFDQGNRISQGIGFADVADVCLRALHSTEAVNKCFEVCYEYTSEEGLQMYELVAHLPDKSNNYLVPALAGLVRNT